MNALATYLAKHHYDRKTSPPVPKVDFDTAALLLRLAQRMEKAAEALQHADIVRVQLNDRLSGRRARVLLQSGQKNPTEVKILGFKASTHTYSTEVGYHIEVAIELVNSEPFARMRRRSIPLNQLVEVMA